MKKFANAFKQARLNSNKTFRRLKEEVGLSIGYLSDIENGKRNPPEIAIVEKLEKSFGITDNRLVIEAKRERVDSPNAIGHLIDSKPLLKEVLLRADALPSDGLDELLERLRSDHEGDDPWLLLSFETLKHFDKELFNSI